MRVEQLVALSAALVISACTLTPPAPPQASTAPTVNQDKPLAPSKPVAEPAWAEYLERSRTLGAEVLTRETAEAAMNASSIGRLKLAMLLVAPAHPSRDDQRAQALAEEVAASPGAPARTRDAAALFAQLISEQRRSAEAAKRVQTRSVEDQRRIEQFENRAKEAERRATDAERKLEALKQIDKALTERTPAAPR